MHSFICLVLHEFLGCVNTISGGHVASKCVVSEYAHGEALVQWPTIHPAPPSPRVATFRAAAPRVQLPAAARLARGSHACSLVRGAARRAAACCRRLHSARRLPGRLRRGRGGGGVCGGRAVHAGRVSLFESSRVGPVYV
eukprot:264950-Chlamydomonas_euryale.AAC.1